MISNSLNWNISKRSTKICSYESVSVSYSGGNDWPEAGVTVCSHNNLFPWATLPRSMLLIISSFQSDHHPCNYDNLLQRINFTIKGLTISTAFRNFHNSKFILNFNNEHAQNFSCPGTTFAFCSHGEQLFQQDGLPGSEESIRQMKLLRG